MANKTQVALNPQVDFPRTRLTHSLEVARVGRQLARICADIVQPEENRWRRSFGTNLADAVAAVCLCHDIGHPPFGHAAEEVLNELLLELEVGQGFEGNKQNIRILCGGGLWRDLGLTAAVLDGLMKYKTAASCGPSSPKLGAVYDSETEVKRNIVLQTGCAAVRNPICYLAEAADDISNLAADVEDALKCGWVSPKRVAELLSKHAVGFTEYWKPIESHEWNSIVARGEEVSDFEEVKSAMIKGLLNHCVQVLIEVLRPLSKSPEDVDRWPKQLNDHLGDTAKYMDGKNVTSLVFYRRSSSGPVDDSQKCFLSLKNEIYDKGILQAAVIKESECQARIVVLTLWNSLSQLAKDPCLPHSKYLLRFLPATVVSRIKKEPSEQKRYLLVADYISGMTDRFALQTLDRLAVRDGILRHKA